MLQQVWVVYGRYRDDDDLPFGCEEFCFDCYADACDQAEAWRNVGDYQDVWIKSELRDFYVMKKGR